MRQVIWLMLNAAPRFLLICCLSSLVLLNAAGASDGSIYDAIKDSPYLDRPSCAPLLATLATIEPLRGTDRLMALSSTSLSLNMSRFGELLAGRASRLRWYRFNLLLAKEMLKHSKSVIPLSSPDPLGISDNLAEARLMRGIEETLEILRTDIPYHQARPLDRWKIEPSVKFKQAMEDFLSPSSQAALETKIRARYMARPSTEPDLLKKLDDLEGLRALQGTASSKVKDFIHALENGNLEWRPFASKAEDFHGFSAWLKEIGYSDEPVIAALYGADYRTALEEASEIRELSLPSGDEEMAELIDELKHVDARGEVWGLRSVEVLPVSYAYLLNILRTALDDPSTRFYKPRRQGREGNLVLIGRGIQFAFFEVNNRIEKIAFRNLKETELLASAGYYSQPKVEVKSPSTASVGVKVFEPAKPKAEPQIEAPFVPLELPAFQSKGDFEKSAESNFQEIAKLYPRSRDFVTTAAHLWLDVPELQSDSGLTWYLSKVKSLARQFQEGSIDGSMAEEVLLTMSAEEVAKKTKRPMGSVPAIEAPLQMPERHVNEFNSENFDLTSLSASIEFQFASSDLTQGPQILKFSPDAVLFILENPEAPQLLRKIAESLTQENATSKIIFAGRARKASKLVYRHIRSNQWIVEVN